MERCTRMAARPGGRHLGYTRVAIIHRIQRRSLGRQAAKQRCIEWSTMVRALGRRTFDVNLADKTCGNIRKVNDGYDSG